jgi:hypothetical protein
MGCHFFFMGDGFQEWLTSCKVVLTPEMFVRLYKHEHNILPAILHFPKGSSPCLLVYPVIGCEEEGKGKVRDVELHVQNGIGVTRISLTRTLDTSKDEPEFTLAERLALSCLAYLLAFPDMIHNGVPDDLKHAPKYNGHACHQVRVSPSVRTHDGPSPHYRNGHFRLLINDRFTHKKGQVVFVHGCFVKGEAATVLGNGMPIRVSAAASPSQWSKN